MSPGAIEETGKVMSSAVDALKATPTILAILIFNIILLGVIAWSGHEQGNRWEKMAGQLISQCGPKVP
jgi:hypothetical protein